MVKVTSAFERFKSSSETEIHCVYYLSVFQVEEVKCIKWIRIIHVQTFNTSFLKMQKKRYLCTFATQLTIR